jgi:serine protease Do
MTAENKTAQLKSFLIGLAVSLVILTSFFAGAIADRIFVIRPLNSLFARSQPLGQEILSTISPLRSLLDSGEVMSVADIAEAASQSVVTVSVKQQQQVIDLFSSRFFGFGFPGEDRVEEIQRDIGTGFVVDESGLVVTNKHVVANTQAEYLLIDKNDREYRVSRIYRDPVNDMAILKVEGLRLPPLPLGNSDQLRVGDDVIAIGTALGEFRHTVTTGVISGLGRGIQAVGEAFQLESLEGVIQTDAAINPGNSGGPLLNRRGEVIGVNVAVSQRAQNIGFAIPINVIKSSVTNFNETGQFDRPFLGIRYQMISQQAALANEVPQGAYIVEVMPDSVLAEAGLRSGDIITQLAGESLKDNDLARVMNTKRVGEKISLRYWREGREEQAQVTLKAGQ